ncbi:MAG: DUF1254 domain-containing protein [Acidobacteria bacterium]|nr:MAG: DUF1254 domain-containing protein [Acidobacteriota bacterium]
MLEQHEQNQIAEEAYLFLYPLVLMDVTRKVGTNVPLGVKPGLGPSNVFSHMSAFPPGDFKEVVRPNFDTLYSIVFLDLTEEPMVVSAADTDGRYYMLPMMDMWTDVFAAPGSRTTGTGAGHFALVPQGWDGAVPDGTTRIEAPTPYVWIIGRTQTNGPADYEAVHQVQSGFVATPLSRWPEAPLQVDASVEASVDMDTAPLDQVNSMSGLDFFSYAAELMQLHRPHVTDQPITARMARLGLDAGKPFNFDALPQEVRHAFEGAPGSAQETMQSALPRLNPVVNGWSIGRANMGVYGTNYLYRAVIAMVGLGANLVEDAVYPLLLHDSSGDQPVGDHNYVLHFDADRLPPVDAFWSVTMYDGEGFPVLNPLERYALGDRDPLVYSDDGSLDLNIGHESPGPDREPNWLPAPLGPLGVTMRLYAPRPEILDGRWDPPPLKRI